MRYVLPALSVSGSSGNRARRREAARLAQRQGAARRSNNVIYYIEVMAKAGMAPSAHCRRVPRGQSLPSGAWRLADPLPTRRSPRRDFAPFDFSGAASAGGKLGRLVVDWLELGRMAVGYVANTKCGIGKEVRT
jgi:hypothetical protein